MPIGASRTGLAGILKISLSRRSTASRGPTVELSGRCADGARDSGSGVVYARPLPNIPRSTAEMSRGGNDPDGQVTGFARDGYCSR
jgi:hypothetical protein